MQVRSAECYPCRATKLGVTVAAECWSSGEQRRKLFRGDPGREVLPVRLIIINNGSSCVRFSRTRAQLRLLDGETLRAVPTSTISEKLQHGDAAAIIIHVATLGYGGVIAQAVSGATQQENRRRRQATRNCSMELAVIDPGKTLAGFVFFELPSRARAALKDGAAACLVITHLPCDGGEPLSFTVNLHLDESKSLAYAQTEPNTPMER